MNSLLQDFSVYILIGCFIVLIFNRSFERGINKSFEEDGDIDEYTANTMKMFVYFVFIAFWLPLIVYFVTKPRSDET